MSPRARCATSCATTRARRACAASSARSAKICRKVVKALLLKQSEGKARKAREPVEVNSKNLDKYLGVRALHLRHRREAEPGRPGHRPRVDRGRRRAADDRGGRAAGQGQDDVTTGKLGEVMNESIQAALSVVRRGRSGWASPRTSTARPICTSTCPRARRPRTVRPPASAIVTAIVSVLTGIPVRCDVAMTGEITLRGEVLPIGGLKEKLLAAHAAESRPC